MSKLMTLTFITSILFFTSCGIPLPLQKDLIVKYGDASRQFETTNPVFNSYIASFEQKGKVITNDGNFEVGDIPINFGNTEDDDFQGVCFEYPDGKKEIIIRKAWWDATSNDEYRESLIYHELGHCKLGRDHLDVNMTVDDKVFKGSMMNSKIVPPSDYQSLKEEYHMELFTNDTTELLRSLGLTATP